MKKILIINLQDGSNEIEDVTLKMMEQIEKFCVRVDGDKVIWKCEEFMYVEL